MTCFLRAYLSGNSIVALHTSDEPILRDVVQDETVDTVVTASVPIGYLSASDMQPLIGWTGQQLTIAGAEVSDQVIEARLAGPPAPPLTPAQFSYFLDVTGFRAILDAALDALPKGTLAEKATWAAMKAVAYDSASYRVEVTLALVAQVASMGLPSVTLPTDTDIRKAWALAAAFQGAASLGVGG